MNIVGIAAVAALAASLLTTAASAQETSRDMTSPSDGRTVRVSCNRSLTRAVIWDRPNGVFLQDLRAAGYDAEKALAIGTTICRDERFVGDPEGLGDATRDILRSDPPRR